MKFMQMMLSCYPGGGAFAVVTDKSPVHVIEKVAHQWRRKKSAVVLHILPDITDDQVFSRRQNRFEK